MTNSVQECFERRATLHPDAPAVYAADGECWSYSHLNEFANQVAHRLLRHGMAREARVGVCMRRSPQTVGVLLGILKARAAYVPLDLNLPDERLRYIAEDAAMNYVFVDTPGYARLRDSRVGNIEVLPATANEGYPSHSPELDSQPSDLANILYTSGSTGKPKGVMLEHSGVLRLVTGTKWLAFSAKYVFLQISALSFDLSTFEVWGPLLNGGSVVTAPQSPSLDEIGRLLDKFKVPTLWLAAGLFNVLMDERPSAIAKIAHLLTGGDIASPRHAREALLHLEYGELLNCYGPTENATFSTCHRVKLTDTERSSIPIGIPVDKSPVYLLDESMQPIHDLRVGEVFVGGEGLARGYWNRPELTAEKFLQLEVEPGVVKRLYRTGDLGRYNDAGLLEFVGRTDFQLKIRGCRVEPEEIELALSSMPGLASAAIVAKGHTAETKQLYCYYIQGAGAGTSPAALKAFLQVKFPSYMIPTVFVALPALPLNTNGKVDRKTLERLAVAAGADREMAAENKTRTEAALLEIWKDMLGIQQISLDDCFFALGGNSLLAARLFAQIQKRFARQPPLSAILHNSTVRKLAALLDNGADISDRASLVPLNSCEAPTNLFLIHPVGGSVLTYKRLGELLPAHAVYGLDAERILGQAATDLSIEQIASRYIETIRKHQPSGPYLVGGFSAGGVISFEIARQLQEAGQTLDSVIIIDTRLSPSLRAVLLGFRFRELVAVLGRIRRQYPILIRRFGLRGFLQRNWNDLRTARRMAARRAVVGATISGANTPDLAESILMAHDRYVPKSFEGHGILYTTAETLAANENIVSEWRHLLLGGVQWRALPGNHSNVLQDPQVSEFAEDLARALGNRKTKAENPTAQPFGRRKKLMAC